MSLLKARSASVSERGAALAEYSLTIGLIAVLSIGAVLSTGEEVEEAFCRAANALGERLAAVQGRIHTPYPGCAGLTGVPGGAVTEVPDFGNETFVPPGMGGVYTSRFSYAGIDSITAQVVGTTGSRLVRLQKMDGFSWVTLDSRTVTFDGSTQPLEFDLASLASGTTFGSYGHFRILVDTMETYFLNWESDMFPPAEPDDPIGAGYTFGHIRNGGVGVTNGYLYDGAPVQGSYQDDVGLAYDVSHGNVVTRFEGLLPSASEFSGDVAAADGWAVFSGYLSGAIVVVDAPTNMVHSRFSTGSNGIHTIGTSGGFVAAGINIPGVNPSSYRLFTEDGTLLATMNTSAQIPPMFDITAGRLAVSDTASSIHLYEVAVPFDSGQVPVTIAPGGPIEGFWMDDNHLAVRDGDDDMIRVYRLSDMTQVASISSVGRFNDRQDAGIMEAGRLYLGLDDGSGIVEFDVSTGAELATHVMATGRHANTLPTVNPYTFDVDDGVVYGAITAPYSGQAGEEGFERVKRN